MLPGEIGYTYAKPTKENPHLSYGENLPGWMRPAHHPDYRPIPRAKLKPASHPEDKPFRWETTCKRATLASELARLKNHPPAKTYRGEYPEAPPSGQENRGSQVWPTEQGCFIVDPQNRYTATFPRDGFTPFLARERAA